MKSISQIVLSGQLFLQIVFTNLSENKCAEPSPTGAAHQLTIDLFRDLLQQRMENHNLLSLTSFMNCQCSAHQFIVISEI